MDQHSKYISPLSNRYASEEMQYLFSEEFKFKTFRRLWIILAKEEKKLGLNITDEQIKELEDKKDDINYDVIKEREKITRHDVMAQIYGYGVQCPKAKGIIHLGATSCYVDDNTDAIIIREASKIILAKCAQVLANLKKFSLKYKALPCLAYTHLQPAQLTTVGKRATLWMNELAMDVKNLEYQMENFMPLGQKGTTGTQASFLDLFNGDKKKVLALDRNIAKTLGFKRSVYVSGQTYSRKMDSYVLECLAGIATSSYKFSNDLRILQSFKEIEEPFEKTQVGSSAMPYKRNPMRAERISSLSRYVIVEVMNSNLTAASQFMERTLDDSANRRLVLSESFLTVDAILNIYMNITDGLVVNKKIIEKRVQENLPFMATENIMMEAVKKGQDRQVLHERIRELSQRAGDDMKQGKENKLLSWIVADPLFKLDDKELKEILNPSKFIGMSVEQTEMFNNEVVDPILKKYHKKRLEGVLKL